MTMKNNLFLKLKEFFSSKIGIIFIYFLLTLFFTFPLMLNFRDSIPGEAQDSIGTMWFLWFFKHSLFDLQINPFAQNDLLFYPAGFTISTGYDALFATIISLPLQLITKNLIIVYNIIVVFNFVFSSYTAYLLIKYLTNDKKISFIAGIIFAFSPYMIARSLGHINLLTTGAIPLFILFFLKSLKEPSFKNSLLLALSFLLVSLSSWQYGLFIMLFVFFSLTFLYFTSRKIIINKPYLTSFASFLILSAFLVLPFAFPMISNSVNDKMFLPTNGDAIMYSADVLSYITPPPTNTFFGNFINKDTFNSFSGNYIESPAYLGLFEIIFIIYFFLIIKKNKFEKVVIENIYWIVMAFIFFILSLGPLLKIGGHISDFILPYWFLFDYVPFFNFAKEPVRLSIFVMLFIVIIFSVFLKTYLSQNKRKNIILFLIVLIIIAEKMTLPYQTKKIETPVFYNKIAEEKNDYAILDLPANIRWFQQPMYNYYQMTHKKKIIVGAVGYTSFSSDIYSWIEQNNFVKESICYYGAYEKNPNIAETETKFNKNKLLQDFKDIKIKYVVVHKDVFAFFESYEFDCQKVKNNINNLFKDENSVFEDDLIKVYDIAKMLKT